VGRISVRSRHHCTIKGLGIQGYFITEIWKAPTPAVSAPQQRLADVSQRRRQLLHTRTAEHNRAEHYTDPLCVRQARQLQKTLEKQIAQCDQAIITLIAADTDLAQKAKRLEAIAGVGPVVAATVLAEMPELGNSTRRPPPPWPEWPRIIATAER